MVFPDKFCIFAPMEAKNKYDNLSDQEIVNGLLNRNNRITKIFFWEMCGKLFGYIIKELYNSTSDSDQLKERLIQDLYIYLMDKDARLLRKFDYRAKLTTWLARVAYRFFLNQKKKERKIPTNKAEFVDLTELKYATNDDFKVNNATKIIDQILEAMPNQDLAYIFRKRELEKCSYEELAQELNFSINYLYNRYHEARVMFIDTFNKIEIDYE